MFWHLLFGAPRPFVCVCIQLYTRSVAPNLAPYVAAAVQSFPLAPPLPPSPPLVPPLPLPATPFVRADVSLAVAARHDIWRICLLLTQQSHKRRRCLPGKKLSLPLLLSAPKPKPKPTPRS